MRIANISTLKNELSRFLKYVQKGEKVRIFDRRRPVADLVPVDTIASNEPSPDKALLESLSEKGIAKLGTAKIPKEVFAPLPGETGDRPGSSGVLEALLKEREEGQ